MDLTFKDVLQFGWTALAGFVAWAWNQHQSAKKELEVRMRASETSMNQLATQLAVQQTLFNQGNEDRREIKQMIKELDEKIDRIIMGRSGNGTR